MGKKSEIWFLFLTALTRAQLMLVTCDSREGIWCKTERNSLHNCAKIWKFPIAMATRVLGKRRNPCVRPQPISCRRAPVRAHWTPTGSSSSTLNSHRHEAVSAKQKRQTERRAASRSLHRVATQPVPVSNPSWHYSEKHESTSLHFTRMPLLSFWNLELLVAINSILLLSHFEMILKLSSGCVDNFTQCSLVFYCCLKWSVKSDPHTQKQTATYSWQWRWRSCEPGCPRCWPLCSCRIRHQPEWRPAGSALALGPGHWGGGVRGNAPRWQWEPGIPRWCHRTSANPAQDPPPLCRSPTAGSWEALEGRGKNTSLSDWVMLSFPTLENLHEQHRHQTQRISTAMTVKMSNLSATGCIGSVMETKVYQLPRWHPKINLVQFLLFSGK